MRSGIGMCDARKVHAPSLSEQCCSAMATRKASLKLCLARGEYRGRKSSCSKHYCTTLKASFMNKGRRKASSFSLTFPKELERRHVALPSPLKRRDVEGPAS